MAPLRKCLGPFRLFAGVLSLLICACSITGGTHDNADHANTFLRHDTSTFPLDRCEGAVSNPVGQSAADGANALPCIASLFPKGDMRSDSKDPAVIDPISVRTAFTFPQRYLELYEEDVRNKYCEEFAPDPVPMGGTRADRVKRCTKRLSELSKYFNPNGKPKEGMGFGVALEGGGTKSAPFALGVLAGLEEMGALQVDVRAISSVSGGSYAASYLFNRLLDKSLVVTTGSSTPPAGGYEDWFRSCIPDEFSDGKKWQMFAELRAAPLPDPFPACGEKLQKHPRDRCNPFEAPYEFMGHVWMDPDIIMGNAANGLKAPETGIGQLGDPITNTVELAAESVASMPWEVLARDIFRWPGSSSPTKFAYTNGLERQYGYSPLDWRKVEKDADAEDDGISLRRDLAHVLETHERRMQTRTMDQLGRAIRDLNGPDWILGSSTPGPLGLMAWLDVETADPVRHQFELSPHGYGSGIHGYVTEPPVTGEGFLESDFMAPGSLLAPRTPSEQMPIVEAVVASAAFFDDAQSAYNEQPSKTVLDVAQTLVNLEWSRELPNFNDSDVERTLQRVSPYPIWTYWTGKVGNEPYIHLQDGGNSENSGILPLLRRGYDKIIFAHATQDNTAIFKSVCHLKNQLELDGGYYITSPELERVIAPFQPGGQVSGEHDFRSYLDQLCTEQLDDSDLAIFDKNTAIRDLRERPPAVAKLVCGRLGYAVPSTDRRLPDPDYVPCEVFQRQFYPTRPDPDVTGGLPIVLGAKSAFPRTYRKVEDLFYRWSGGAITFIVYRGDALEHLPEPGKAALESTAKVDELSRIYTISPTISWADASSQVFRVQQSAAGSEVFVGASIPGSDLPAEPWKEFCEQPDEARRELHIGACNGPGNRSLSVSGRGDTEFRADPVLPCTSLAHILADSCRGKSHPTFPQDSFIGETWNTTYTMYAAYFDLGRRQIWRAVDQERIPIKRRDEQRSPEPGLQSTCPHQ